MGKKIIFTMFLALFISCDSQYQTLSHLEPFLRSAPDSVLMILSSMDCSHSSRRAAAYHALLTIAEQDISDLNPSSDSLIDIAFAYYSKRPDTHHKMMAYYYKGIVNYAQSRYPDAIISLEKAANLAQKRNNDLYVGLSYRNIAHIYNENYETTDAKRSILLSIEAFERAQQPEYTESSRLEYAEILQQSEQDAQADSIFKIVIRNSANYPLINYALRSYAYLMEIKDENDAKAVLDTYGKGGEYGYSSGDYSKMAYACSYVQPSSVDSLLYKAKSTIMNDTDLARLLYYRSKISEKNEDYKEALLLRNNEFRIQDSIILLQLQQSLTSSLNQLYKNKEEIASLEAKNSRITALGIAGLSLLLIAILAWRLQRSRRQKEEFLAQISEARLILSDRDHVNIQLIKAIIMSKISDLEDAAKCYEKTIGTKEEAISYRRLRDKVHSLQNDKHLYVEIETALDIYHNGIVKKARQDFPNLTANVFQLMLLFFAHIPQSTIALLRNTTLGSIKTSKSRLRAKFKESTSPNRNLYLSLLDA